MADLDTRSKRSSSVQIMAPYILAPPAPDDQITLQDKKQSLWLYAGGRKIRPAGPFACALAEYPKP